MRIRIYYDGYEDTYKVQHKTWYRVWRTFTMTHSTCFDDWIVYASFNSLEDADKYFEKKKVDILVERKEKQKAKEAKRLAKIRAKDSRVVREEVV